MSAVASSWLEYMSEKHVSQTETNSVMEKNSAEGREKRARIRMDKPNSTAAAAVVAGGTA